MSSNYTFKGWLGLDKNALGNMQYKEFQPKPFDEDDDVDIQITHSGICGSDIHVLRNGWGNTMYPVCVGHEIVGKAVRVGKNVKKNIKVGDRVGVGAQAASCLKPECEECASGMEQHCLNLNVGTFNSKFPDGSVSYGGYANYNRTPSHFVFKIPDGLPSEFAAPMLCGGVTVYSPLRTFGCGPGKRVGIVGVGGLGHFGVIFAKALGADRVVGMSRTNGKRADALAMGADDYIATDEDKDWHKRHRGTLDLIVCTVSGPKMPLSRYLQLLRTRGTFVQVGAPEEQLPGFNAFSLIGKGVKLVGSMIGSPGEIEEMLELSASQKIRPWVQQRSMREANQAVVDMHEGKARYRYCLINDDAKL